MFSKKLQKSILPIKVIYTQDYTMIAKGLEMTLNMITG